MVIDSDSSYSNFLNDNSNGRCIIHIIVNNDDIHCACNRPLMVFIKNIDIDKTYIINIDHYDIKFKIPKEKLVNDLNNLYCTKFVLDKKRFLHILPLLNLKDLQLIDFIGSGKLDETEYLTNSYKFYYTRFKNYQSINNAIPITIHSKIFDNICNIYEESVESFKEDDTYNKVNDDIIENLQTIESNGLYVNPELFHKYYKDKSINPVDNLVYTEYNIYTSTGRPSNRFGGINYSALSRDSGCRSSFISRYGKDGMLLLIDYSAYHPHIVAKLINYNLPHNVYNYLGKYYYGKDELTDDEIKLSKNMTFQCMYGNIPDELLEIPYFKKMKEYIEHRWIYFNENGYVETPIYKRRITKKHISDPNPNKLFNYILQASETEFGMSVLSDINEYLTGKLTKVVLYTYDSLLYDINKEDGKRMIYEIKRIMGKSGFPIKCYVGYNYHDMITVNI